jgi:membrane peptidoglycan carboxypeptidase
MAAGYGSFANRGFYVEPRPYSKVTNRRDEIIINREDPAARQVMDEGAAFIMTDILRTTVTNGIAGRASIPSQPVAGKTGTTTEKYDAWFVGLTPQYSASLWIGCDVGVELSEGSGAATRVWSKIMQQICEGLERGSFPGAPDNIASSSVDSVSGLLPSEYSTTRSEYFIKGTEPTEIDTLSAPLHICPISGYIATPYCPARVLFSPGDDPENPNSRPAYYCHLHNSAPEEYPIDPEQVLNPDFYWDGILRDDAYYESLFPDENADGLPDDAQPGMQPDTEGESGVGPWPNPSTAPPETPGGSGETPAGGAQDGSGAGSANGGTQDGDPSNGETPPDSGAPPPDWLNLNPSEP